jgi:hypothetical protein
VAARPPASAVRRTVTPAAPAPWAAQSQARWASPAARAAPSQAGTARLVPQLVMPRAPL